MKIYFKLSNEAIAENLKKGIELKQNQIIDVDFASLEQEDRELLLRHLKIQNDKAYSGIYQKSTSGSAFGSIDSHYGCYELSGPSIEEIILFYRNFEVKGLAEKKYREQVVARAEALKEQYDTPEFSIYLQSPEGKFEQINFQYKGVSFTPGVWAKLQDLEQAAKSGELEEWIKKVDREKEKESKAAADKAKAEVAKKAAIEAGRTELLAWAKENGSELLKLRIKHGQNWQEIALEEWAVSHATGFESWKFDESVEEWTVYNATIDQLIEVEKAESDNPDHEIDIMRSKFMYKTPDYDGIRESDYYHKTFLRCYVKTPLGPEILYREIEDVSEKE